MFGLCEFTFLLVSCYSIVIEPSNYESKYKNLPGWLLLLSDKQTRISFFLSQSLTNINTYVGKDKKLHFVDSSGADTVLPFKSYDDGRIQGRNDVIGSPNSYGLYTKAQYDANKVTYKSGNYNTGLNGETWRSTSFNTGFSTIIALQINCWNDEGNGYFNAFKNVRISGGKVSLDFYAADYVDNYVRWLAVGK